MSERALSCWFRSQRHAACNRCWPLVQAHPCPGVLPAEPYHVKSSWGAHHAFRKTLRQCCPQSEGTKFHEGLVVGSQFTQKTNGFPESWDPTTNPSWNFVPFELGTTLPIFSPKLRGTKFHGGLVMGSQFVQKMIEYPVNWDPTTDPHADSVPPQLGPTLTRDLV